MTRPVSSARLVAPGSPPAPPLRETVLSARDLATDRDGGTPLRDVSFDLREGEILGIAGVDGNGQGELVAALAGVLRPSRGRIRLGGEDVTRRGVEARWRRGLSVLPGDRGREGLVLDMTIWENLALREFGEPWARWWSRGPVRPSIHRERAIELSARHDVRGPGPEAPGAALSGGNQQKLLLARELAADPRALVILNPGRGLDVGAVDGLWQILGARRAAGVGILLVSTDLDEVLERADRWAVMHDGHLEEADGSDRERIGAMMLGETPS